MKTAMLEAVDSVNQAKEIAYGLRGLITELDLSRVSPSSSEAAALAALAQTIGDRCDHASHIIDKLLQTPEQAAES